MCLAKTRGGSSNSNFPPSPRDLGWRVFFPHLVHWCVSAEGRKRKQFSLMSPGADVSKESAMLLGAYIDM